MSRIIACHARRWKIWRKFVGHRRRHIKWTIEIKIASRARCRPAWIFVFILPLRAVLRVITLVTRHSSINWVRTVIPLPVTKEVKFPRDIRALGIEHISRDTDCQIKPDHVLRTNLYYLRIAIQFTQLNPICLSFEYIFHWLFHYSTNLSVSFTCDSLKFVIRTCFVDCFVTSLCKCEDRKSVV